MELKWHERVASCGLGERLPTKLRATTLPFKHRFGKLPGLSSSLPHELCCPAPQNPAKRPRHLVVSEASCSPSLAAQRACFRATSVAALAFGRGALRRAVPTGGRCTPLSCSATLSSLVGKSLQSRLASRLVVGASLRGSIDRAISMASMNLLGGWGSGSLRSALLVFERRAQEHSWSADRRPRPGRRTGSGKLFELGRVTRRLKRTRKRSSAVVPCGRSWLRAPLVPCMGAA